MSDNTALYQARVALGIGKQAARLGALHELVPAALDVLSLYAALEQRCEALEAQIAAEREAFRASLPPDDTIPLKITAGPATCGDPAVAIEVVMLPPTAGPVTLDREARLMLADAERCRDMPRKLLLSWYLGDISTDELRQRCGDYVARYQLCPHSGTKYARYGGMLTCPVCGMRVEIAMSGGGSGVVVPHTIGGLANATAAALAESREGE